MNYAVHLAIYFSISALLAMSVNLVTGYGGYLTFATSSFFAIGAYLRAEPPFISAPLALQRRHIRSDFIGRPDNCLWHSLQLVFGVSPFGFYTESDERSLRNCRYIDPILLRHLTRIANLSPRTGGDSAKQRNACHHADCIISLWNTRPVHERR